MPAHKQFLIRHLGNMGDMVFFIPPVLETLKKEYPDCHITFVTAWGFKQKMSWKQLLTTQGVGGALNALSHRERPTTWGMRNQGGFNIALMMTNPHIDQLVHWHDSLLDLAATTCHEEDRFFPTWNKAYYEEQKKSGLYDGAWELDFGVAQDGNPLEEIYAALGLPSETYSNYKLYFSDEDQAIAAAVMKEKPRPRIVLLEALAAENTRGWDANKIPQLIAAIKNTYGVDPLWFGGKHIPHYQGRALTLRQNIATLQHADVAIGVLSGPLHFAAAVGLPTITLLADQPLHRAAPAYFLNEYIAEPQRRHRTIVGPSPDTYTYLKSDIEPTPLTSAERAQQHYAGWLSPGRQATKAALAPLTVDEIMLVLHDMLKKI